MTTTTTQPRRPRGMCYTCYVDPFIRVLYPAASNVRCARPGCQRRLSPTPRKQKGTGGLCQICRDAPYLRKKAASTWGHGLSAAIKARLAEAEALAPTVGPEPTTARPGDARRLAAYIQRAALGLAIKDRRDDGAVDLR
jgi:hypothetical protein